MAVTNDGHVLVTDHHRLQKVTFDGVCVKSVGGSECGSGQLQFYYPAGIAVHPTTGQIFVADENNHRVQVFNADLSYSHTIPTYGGTKFRHPGDQLKHPGDVAVDNEGCVYVAD